MTKYQRIKRIHDVCGLYEQQLGSASEGDVQPFIPDFMKSTSSIADWPEDELDDLKTELLTLELQHALMRGGTLRNAAETLRKKYKGHHLKPSLISAIKICKADPDERKTPSIKGPNEILDKYFSPAKLSNQSAKSNRSQEGALLPIEENRFDGPGERKQLGPFLLKSKIGAGSFGVVFLAQDFESHQKVALKIPRLSLTDSDVAIDEINKSSRKASRLNHKNIVKSFPATFFDGYYCFGSEYVTGGNLKTLIDNAGSNEPCLSEAKALQIALQLCDALNHAHAFKIIHGGITPSNVMLIDEPDGTVAKLADFGYATILDKASNQRVTGSQNSNAYMSPERLLKRELTTKSDIYSLGVILYEMLTGKCPFESDNQLELAAQVIERVPDDAEKHHPGLPPALSSIVHRCLHKDPNRRYESAADLKQDLQRFQSGAVVQAKRNRVLEQVGNWSLQKQRILDAGYFSVALNVVMPLWTIIMVPFYMRTEFADQLDFPNIIFTCFLLILFFHLPLLWTASETIQFRIRGPVIGAIISLVNILFAIGVFAGFIDVRFGGIYDDTLNRLTTFSLLIILFSFQFAAYAIAANLLRSKKRFW